MGFAATPHPADGILPADLLALEREWLPEAAGAAANGRTVWIAPRGAAYPPGAATVLECGAGELGGCLRCLPASLPFGDDAVPRIVLQHALDEQLDLLPLLGECARVLRPGGELVVFGIEPISAWHPWLRARARRAGRHLRPRLAARLAALLGRLGLDTVACERLGSRWPAAHATGMAPGVGGPLRAVYALCARKSSATVIPLRQRALAQRPAQAGLVPARREMAGAA
jgi:SAM-dependent methyltransferase